MTTDPKGFEALRAVHPTARLLSEGGIVFVFLPKLKIWSDGAVVERDALLCPQAHTGYETRLFLDSPVAGKGDNWTTHHILSRTWHSWSWRGVSPDLALPEMIANHLRALR